MKLITLINRTQVGQLVRIRTDSGIIFEGKAFDFIARGFPADIRQSEVTTISVILEVLDIRIKKEGRNG